MKVERIQPSEEWKRTIRENLAIGRAQAPPTWRDWVRATWDLSLVFVLAMGAVLAYVWLALRGVTYWKIVPLMIFVGWAYSYLMKPARHLRR